MFIYMHICIHIYISIFPYTYLCIYKDYALCDQGKKKKVRLNWLCVFVYICVDMKIFV